MLLPAPPSRDLELPAGQGFVLRPVDPSMVGALLEAAIESRPEVGQWMDWATEDLGVSDIKDFASSSGLGWGSCSAFEFHILDASDGRMVGGCGLNSINAHDRTANLGYWVRTSRTGEGAATAATLALRDYGFGVLGLQRIEIVVGVGNEKSRRVAERAGAVHEGRLANRLRLWGKPLDADVFRLIPEA